MVEFFPISLKGKKLPGLISELNEKEITLVFDCRRFNSRTASWFHWDFLKRDLLETEIHYIIFYDLSNKDFLKDESLFIGTVNKFLMQIYDNRNFYFRTNKKVGLFCYCPEIDMKNDLCHCSWISKHLNLFLGAF